MRQLGRDLPMPSAAFGDEVLHKVWREDIEIRLEDDICEPEVATVSTIDSRQRMHGMTLQLVHFETEEVLQLTLGVVVLMFGKNNRAVFMLRQYGHRGLDFGFHSEI